ncbi:MAG: FemAB family XrtA/PEP-CTERM system-associated protein [Pirellula sp.]|jgi:serine/alanine adding enzyme
MPIEIHRTFAEWPEIDPGVRYPRLNAHCVEWYRAVSEGLHHPCYLLVQRGQDGKPHGLLPLQLVKSMAFGKFLVSLPYVNTGGVWAENESCAKELVSAACDLADELDVRYLELRHETLIDHPRWTMQRTDKVHMRLPLPATVEELNRSFKSKLRSQLKKIAMLPFQLHWGGRELLRDFYAIFSHNMRDLGTPVVSRKLFESILSEFSDRAELCVVKLYGNPLATALLVHQNQVTEVPSASSLRVHNATGVNMWMYHHLLMRAIDRNSIMFDFGRSSIDSNTYRFKAQWNAIPFPSVWQYYVRRGSANDMRPESSRNRQLIRIWKRLPVGFTRWIGPSIVRGIP